MENAGTFCFVLNARAQFPFYKIVIRRFLLHHLLPVANSDTCITEAEAVDTGGLMCWTIGGQFAALVAQEWQVTWYLSASGMILHFLLVVVYGARRSPGSAVPRRQVPYSLYRVAEQRK